MFNSYDEYLLKNKSVIPFRDISVINKIPNYKNINFDKKYLINYIERNNEAIENTKLDTNYKIKNQEFLDDLFYECINYVIKYIKNNIEL